MLFQIIGFSVLGSIGAVAVMATVLFGMVLFFVLEKLVLWCHCHDNECEVHGLAGSLILIGDAFHNFVVGVVIAAAFLTSISLGVAASMAVIAHEIPQEVGRHVFRDRADGIPRRPVAFRGEAQPGREGLGNHDQGPRRHHGSNGLDQLCGADLLPPDTLLLYF
jgi:hypothetical protein